MNATEKKTRGYVVNCFKSPQGYTLAYGRGSRQLQALVVEEEGEWYVKSGDGANGHGIGIHDRLRDVKASWGEWAVQQYHGAAKPDPTLDHSVNQDQPSEQQPVDERRPQVVPQKNLGNLAGDWVDHFDRMKFEYLVSRYGPLFVRDQAIKAAQELES